MTFKPANLEFQASYERMMAKQINESKGERKRRLSEGHGHAEKLFLQEAWWPAIGHFDDVYPEFEVRDFKDGSRFLDFGVLPWTLKLAIEIDGFGSHWKDVSRWQFADHLMRQNQLIIDGWKVLRFSYDDLVEKPRRCQQAVQQFLGKWGYIRKENNPFLSPIEEAILKIAMTSSDPVTTSIVANKLRIHSNTARKHLGLLFQYGVLAPVRADAKRITGYRITAKASNLFT